MKKILDKIQKAIHYLEDLGCEKKDLKITTSTLIKYDLVIFDIDIFTFVKNKNYVQMFGVNIYFDHYENNIVVYDINKACVNDKYKIIINL
jgi:hypothetical protein